MVESKRSGSWMEISLCSLTKNKELLTLVSPPMAIDVRADACQTRRKMVVVYRFFSSLWKRRLWSRQESKRLRFPRMNGESIQSGGSTYFPTLNQLFRRYYKSKHTLNLTSKAVNQLFQSWMEFRNSIRTAAKAGKREIIKLCCSQNWKMQIASESKCIVAFFFHFISRENSRDTPSKLYSHTFVLSPG